MTHDVTVSAAECGKCNGDIAQWTTREKESWVHMVHFEHLKAQKDAAYDMLVTVLGIEPLKAILNFTREHKGFITVEGMPESTEPTLLVSCPIAIDLSIALRAQREAKK